MGRHLGRHPAAAERRVCPRRWEVFNLVKGVIDHQILGLHNVREVPDYTVYNLTFLAIGGVQFILLGWLLMRAGSRAGVAVRA
jgi:uncharacterized membrane protein